MLPPLPVRVAVCCLTPTLTPIQTQAPTAAPSMASVAAPRTIVTHAPTLPLTQLTIPTGPPTAAPSMASIAAPRTIPTHAPTAAPTAVHCMVNLFTICKQITTQITGRKQTEIDENCLSH